MKIRSLPKITAIALFFLLPVLVAGSLKKKFTAPILPAITYYLPDDLHKNSREVFADRLYDSIHLHELGLQKNVLKLALQGFSKLSLKGKLNRDSILTIADFSKPSREKRFYVIDLKNAKLLFNTRVAHGRNSGAEYARSFSNVMSSNKSSLGFYITDQTYRGENGYSLRLHGIERNINDKAFRRSIVIHGASYADEKFLEEKGMLGRSFGCPAIPMEEHTIIIDAIKNGSCLFIYSPDKKYFQQSTVLNSKG
ncbi:MAG: murein L,D-transpeptidase catalytic domain family protein [Chitinophagaceae bacterium]|nr:murein L,D-transpeptidase catalytic domain family protein [Chitinophagaceae bacterium]